MKSRDVARDIAKSAPDLKVGVPADPGMVKPQEKAIFKALTIRKAPILVSYSDMQGWNMHGAFFDHYLLRKISKHDTKVSVSTNQSVEKFVKFITNGTDLVLPYNPIQPVISMAPITCDDPDINGLLFIPGINRDQDTVREDHELTLINNARNRGQPILAVCGGSWRLWKAFGGELCDVKGHSSKMPLLTTEGSVDNNIQVHRISIKEKSFVWNAMYCDTLESTPFVNSVHWMAPDESTTPASIEVSAVELKDDGVSLGSVEAFESQHGAPIVGIQWHPEAYFKRIRDVSIEDNERQRNIFVEMAKAGDAFHAKRKMLLSLKEKFSQASLLDRKGLFRQLDPVKVKIIEPELIDKNSQMCSIL